MTKAGGVEGGQGRELVEQGEGRGGEIVQQGGEGGG